MSLNYNILKDALRRRTTYASMSVSRITPTSNVGEPNRYYDVTARIDTTAPFHILISYGDRELGVIEKRGRIIRPTYNRYSPTALARLTTMLEDNGYPFVAKYSASNIPMLVRKDGMKLLLLRDVSIHQSGAVDYSRPLANEKDSHAVNQYPELLSVLFWEKAVLLGDNATNAAFRSAAGREPCTYATCAIDFIHTVNTHVVNQKVSYRLLSRFGIDHATIHSGSEYGKADITNSLRGMLVTALISNMTFFMSQIPADAILAA